MSDREQPEEGKSHLHDSLADAEAEIKDLHVGLESRKVIGQAQGILMERLGLDEEHAMAYLRRVSSHTNTKLVVVAQQIVETRELPDVP